MKNTSLLICIVSLIVGTGCSIKKQSTTKSNIKVMSYNIHIASPPSIKPDFSFTDLDAIADVIKREKPDLVSLQEVDKFTVRSGKNSHQAKDIAELTGMYYHFADAVNRSEGTQGNAILSRYPIIKVDSYKLPVPPDSKGETRSLALITVNIRGTEVVFISTHLDHVSDATRAFQVKQVLEILEKYKSYPIIFTGDLNMKPHNEVLKMLDKYLVIANTSLPTFPSVKPKSTIDYILFNHKAHEKFDVVNFYTVDEKYASDHLPLVAEIKLK